MKIKELLLNGQNFADLLKEFSIDAADVRIENEDVILSDPFLQHREIIRENICIEGRNKDGVINFFGTLHCNILNKLAVFEMQGFEQRQLC